VALGVVVSAPSSPGHIVRERARLPVRRTDRVNSVVLRTDLKLHVR